MRSMLFHPISTTACGSSMMLASDWCKSPSSPEPTPGSIVLLLTSPTRRTGFTLIFSSTPFPGHQYRLDWRRAESGGNWYYSADLDMEGWLCSALFRYFPDAPASLYAQIKARA